MKVIRYHVHDAVESSFPEQNESFQQPKYY